VNAESASDRQQQWVLVVRRSFGISDPVADNEARETIIRFFEHQLQVNGWQSAPRAIAEPIVDSLMVLEVLGDVDHPTFTTRDGAQRLLAHGIAVVDPEHLVFDSGFDYPAEILAATLQILERVEEYVREQKLGA
jgi:hypothetical protein